MTRSRDMKTAKKRKCNNCGRVAYRKPASNCLKWDKSKQKNVWCGTMRVIVAGKRNISKLGEWKDGQES